MPNEDTETREQAQPRPVTARALSVLTAHGRLWYSDGWAGSGGAYVRTTAALPDAERLPDSAVARLAASFAVPGCELDFGPEDVGPTDGGRYAIRFAGLWWDAVAIAYLRPARVRLIPADIAHMPGVKVMLMLDETGEVRAALMPMRTDDAEVERAWSRDDDEDEDGWPS